MAAWRGEARLIAGAAACAVLVTAALGTAAAWGQERTQAQGNVEAPNREDMQSIWAKLCGETTDPQKKDRKVRICTTQFEILNRNAAPVMVGAVTNLEGQEQELFSVTVPQGPQGISIGSGVRVRVDQGEVIPLRYTFCFTHGCMAEVPASKQMIEVLKKGKHIVIGLVDAAGNVLSLPVPLQGFAMAYEGQAVDAKKYVDLRKQMIEQYRSTLSEREGAPATGAARPAR